MNNGQQNTKSYGDRVFQIRDISGRKVFQRNSAEEIREWLKKRPTTNYEVWELDAFPGDLKAIKTATEFLNSKKNDNEPIKHTR